MPTGKSQLEPTCFEVLINTLHRFPFGEAFSPAEVCAEQVVRTGWVFVWGSFTAELQLPCSSFQHIQKIETSRLLCGATDRHNKPSLKAASVFVEFSPREIFVVWAVPFFCLLFCAGIAALKAVDTHAQQTLPFIFFSCSIESSFSFLRFMISCFSWVLKRFEKRQKNILIFHGQYSSVENWWMLMLNLNNASCEDTEIQY